MKKTLLSALVMGGFISLNAQNWVSDSVVVGNQYRNRVFYSLADGEVARYDGFGAEADLIIPTYAMTQEVYTAYGTTLFEVLGSDGDTSNWDALTISDPTTIVNGSTYAELNNDPTSYGASSFGNGSATYGWGEYSGSPLHIVAGTRIFLIKTSSAAWKKVWIVKQEGASPSVLTIKLANLDGTGETEVAVTKTATNKDFVYYDIDADVRTDIEPTAGTFDLVFTRWKVNLGSWQAVSGVINAPGVYASRATGLADAAAADAAQFANYPINDSSITTIGDSWKGLSGFAYVVWDSLTYFVSDADQNIWQLSFTKFKTGSGANIGEYVFKKRVLAYASVEEAETVSAWTVFPNPAADFVSVVFNSSVSDNAQFTLLDLNGRTVMTQNFAANAGLNQYSVDLASKNLPAGIYVATLRAGNVLKTTKLIIQ